MKPSALLALLAILPNLGPARPPFRSTLLNAGSRIEEARHQFLKQLAPFENDQPGDPAALKESYARYVQAVADASAIVPSSTGCPGLRRAFVILLAVQHESIKDLGSAVARIETGRGKLDLSGKLNVSGSLNRGEPAEAAALKRFLAAAQDCDPSFHLQVVTFFDN